MKNTILTVALVTTFGAFMFASNTADDITNSTAISWEGEHKCDDKCKKDKDGKCAEAKADNKGEEKAGCCSKDSKKSCHAKKNKSKKKATEETEPKS